MTVNILEENKLKSFRERLGSEWLFWDGGTGTMLQSMGLEAGESPELWNIDYPDKVISVHRSYYEAGSDIVNANTFGANRLKYGNRLKEIITAAIENAKEARRQAGREDDGYIALDIGPTGRLLVPMGDLPFDEAVDIFGEVVRIGAEAGADLILIETMTDSYEAKAAVLAAKENSDLPVCVTTTYDESGKMLTGGGVGSICAMMEGLGVDAIGMNCGLGPVQMLPVAEEMVKTASVPIIVKPNAGLPRQENGRTVYDLDADRFCQAMSRIADLGVHVVGGCCGTTPEYIRGLVGICRQKPFQKPVRKERTVISSYSHAVEIGKRPLIIGERINPTGKKRFKQALKENDLDYIFKEAIRQEEAGADALDVNVGLPEIDEPSMMENVVQSLQGITDLPLQIDTTNREALERGLRIYNGKAMINSVNGRKESMETVFPLAKKYGAIVVALCLDESGIPETADGRIEIARKIIDTAAGYGIPKSDIVIDGLCMTVSSDSNAALATLETVRRCRDELHVNTILGVSNISFGLPRRKIINSNFYAMTLLSGLSCAIINPLDEMMMRAHFASLALIGKDPQCMGYIEACTHFSEENIPAGPGPAAGAGSARNVPARQTTVAGGPVTLRDFIEKGLSAQAASAAQEALRERNALDLINDELIPALNAVGKGFEEKKVFLPQLLMSAEAAKAAFEVMKGTMAGEKKESKGKVILATVKNDIHDIGKNIVKVLLESYGYDVIDLGRDVAPELIVEKAVEDHVRLVGLSALMTTTVVSMEETIRQLRKASPQTKVVVGGAVMTQEYADSIGADCYAKDAMETVRYADSIFG